MAKPLLDKDRHRSDEEGVTPLHVDITSPVVGDTLFYYCMYVGLRVTTISLSIDTYCTGTPYVACNQIRRITALIKLFFVYIPDFWPV